MWNMEARCRWSPADLDRAVLESRGEHHFIYYQCMKGSKLGGITLRPRENISHLMWKRLDRFTLLYTSVPTSHPDKLVTADKERAEMPVSLKIKEVAVNQCKIEYVRKRSKRAHLVDELNLHSPCTLLTLTLFLPNQPSLASHLLALTLAALAGT